MFFTKLQKNNIPDLTLNEARDQIVFRLWGVVRKTFHRASYMPFYGPVGHIRPRDDFSLANYLIINNGRFQVIFTKPQKKEYSGFELNEARYQIVCRLWGVGRKDIPPSELYAILRACRAHRVAQ